MQQLPLGVRLRERASFDAFVDSANREAVHRLESLAAAGRGVVWVWGETGTGKSHLLQAVCAAAPASRRVLYAPLREVLGNGAALLEGSGLLDILCLDDVGRLVGEPEFERALFSAYRMLEERGGALLLSADAPPAALPWRLPDIGSRLSASEVFQLQWLDEDGQCEALRRHAAGRGLELPLETARYLCRRLPRDLARLIEALDRIDEASLSARRRLTVPFMREVLGDS